MIVKLICLQFDLKFDPDDENYISVDSRLTILEGKVPLINKDINIDSLNDMNVHISADKRLDLIELDLSLPTDINAYELRLNNLEEAISGKKADGTLDYDISGDSVKQRLENLHIDISNIEIDINRPSPVTNDYVKVATRMDNLESNIHLIKSDINIDSGGESNHETIDSRLVSLSSEIQRIYSDIGFTTILVLLPNCKDNNYVQPCHLFLVDLVNILENRVTAIENDLNLNEDLTINLPFREISRSTLTTDGKLTFLKAAIEEIVTDIDLRRELPCSSFTIPDCLDIPDCVGDCLTPLPDLQPLLPKQSVCLGCPGCPGCPGEPACPTRTIKVGSCGDSVDTRLHHLEYVFSRIKYFFLALCELFETDEYLKQIIDEYRDTIFLDLDTLTTRLKKIESANTKKDPSVLNLDRMASCINDKVSMQTDKQIKRKQI